MPKNRINLLVAKAAHKKFVKWSPDVLLNSYPQMKYSYFWSKQTLLQNKDSNASNVFLINLFFFHKVNSKSICASSTQYSCIRPKWPLLNSSSPILCIVHFVNPTNKIESFSCCLLTEIKRVPRDSGFIAKFYLKLFCLLILLFLLYFGNKTKQNTV